MEPASLHAGRIYHPAAGGGNLHVNIDSRYPVTVAMTWADDWNASMQNPNAPVNFSFLCIKEHVTSTTYECHLPSERPMIITFHDERRPEKPVVSAISVILGPRVQQFIPTSAVHIQYYAWNCVDNCVLPCFEWRRILNEKYDVTTAPKVYSLMTPDHDDQKLSVKIKSPIPLTVALLPVAPGRPGLRQDHQPHRRTRPNWMQGTRRPEDELQLQLQRRQWHANPANPSRHHLLRTQEGQRRGQYREVRGPLRPAESAGESVSRTRIIHSVRVPHPSRVCCERVGTLTSD